MVRNVRFITTKSVGNRIDILVGDFEMCHKLPMDDRLQVDPVTIPLAELFLSKAQIVQLNRKDAFDIISLLLNNDLGSEKDGKIDVDRIAWLCGNDWGLYKTTSINLKRVEDMLLTEDLVLSHEERELVLTRVRKIVSALASMPKSASLKDARSDWYACPLVCRSRRSGSVTMRRVRIVLGLIILILSIALLIWGFLPTRHEIWS